MSDLKQLEEEFNRLKQRTCKIVIDGKEITTPDGWVAEFAQSALGFRVSMIKLSVRELTLTAEKRVEHRILYYDPQGKLVAENYIDTGWEASGPAIGTGRNKIELPGDYKIIR
jgi:hypothetical protein